MSRPGLAKCPPIIEALSHGIESVATTIESLESDIARLTQERDEALASLGRVQSEWSEQERVIAEQRLVIQDLQAMNERGRESLT